MEIELVQNYSDPGYPVSVNFIERKKEEGGIGIWGKRPDDVEIIIVNNGEVKITLENRKVIKATAGQGIVINKGARHRLNSSTKENTTFYCVVFSPSYVVADEEENILHQKYGFVVEDLERLPAFLLDEANLRDENALDKIDSIIACNTTKKVGYELLTKGYICMLWVLLLEYMATKEPAFNGKNVPSQDELRVRSAIAYMQENFSDHITLDDIAKKVHVSRNECCRCFKRVMMSSPIDYLIKIRIFEAAKILYKDPLSVETISELAFMAGFNNTSYFNRMFKRLCDCTPTEFSKMLKSDPEKARKLFDRLSESVMGL